MGLKTRLKPTEYREGQAQRFLDAIQTLMDFNSRKDLFLPVAKNDDPFAECRYNPKVMDEIMEILRELRHWDITEEGDLYLTSGGRIVLDKGYGEYFTPSDKKIFTLEELHQGIKYEEFLSKIKIVGGK